MKNEGAALPEPKTSKEILSWLLDILRKASSSREIFFKHQANLVDDIIKETEVDDTYGRIIKNADLYLSANVNMIFSLVQSIESFLKFIIHGCP